MTDSALIRFFVVAIHPILRLLLCPTGNSDPPTTGDRGGHTEALAHGAAGTNHDIPRFRIMLSGDGIRKSTESEQKA